MIFDSDNDFIYTRGQKGRIAKQGYVNTVENSLDLKFTHNTKYTH